MGDAPDRPLRYGIVGAGMPIAGGAAFACRYRETDAVAVAFFLAIGTIDWKLGAAILVMGVIGGYWGAVVAKRLPIPISNKTSPMSFATSGQLLIEA